MNVCDFCIEFQKDGSCGRGLNIPKRPACREFNPSMEQFCAEPSDFVNGRQIVNMAAHFGLKGVELKKVRLMAEQEERNRISAAATAIAAFTPTN